MPITSRVPASLFAAINILAAGFGNQARLGQILDIVFEISNEKGTCIY